jgi:hypothetical protein
MIEEPAIPEARTTIRGCVEDEAVRQSFSLAFLPDILYAANIVLDSDHSF